MKHYRNYWSSLLYNVLYFPQEKLRNLQGPVGNENAGKYSKIIMNFKTTTAELSAQHRPSQCGAQVAAQVAPPKPALAPFGSAFLSADLHLCGPISVLSLICAYPPTSRSVIFYF